MLFRLTVPIPNLNSSNELIHNEYFYFESNLSPTKDEILTKLLKQREQISSGNLMYNGSRIREILNTVIEQIEEVFEEDFPEVSQIGHTSHCWVETKYGRKRMYLTIIIPMRLWS